MNTQKGKSSKQKVSRNRGRRDGWMWKGITNRHPIGSIDHATLEPSSSPVSSLTSCELLCTYNWQNSKKLEIEIPGHAPVWQDKQLPITLPQDRGTYFVDQNAARLPEYPFESLFRAAVSMNPSFRFDDIDIVVNRNSLRKLLDFSKGVSQDNFRVNLLIVNNTLFIERCERSATMMIRGSHQTPGYGKSFEQAFTRSPDGMDRGAGHHRVLQYSLGELNCAVQFEVDACYQNESEEEEGEELPDRGVRLVIDTYDPLLKDTRTEESLHSKMENLNIATSSSKRPLTSKSALSRPSPSSRTGPNATKLIASIGKLDQVMPQSSALELKTTAKHRGTGKYLPQLWFGRTPWLIVGHHTNGKFDELKITNLKSEDFVGWETKNQTALQKMVRVLEQLRDVAKKHQGSPCIAIFERRESEPRAINIYPSSLSNKRALPEDLINRLWVSLEASRL
ncbi:hypothetical protein TWF281_004168 [Arthrobotrys megalospora]